VPLADEYTDAFKLLKSVLTELNHAIRTPLGVALNVVRDASLGQQLEAEDFQDATNALNKILGLLNSISPALKYKAEASTLVSAAELEGFLREHGVEALSVLSQAELKLGALSEVLKYLKGRGVRMAWAGSELQISGGLSKLEQLLLTEMVGTSGGQLQIGDRARLFQV